MGIVSTPLIESAAAAITGNIRSALRISLAPFALAVVAFIVINSPNVLAIWRAGGAQVQITGVNLAFLFAGALVVVYASFFVAVRWHQFSLDLHPDRAGGWRRPLVYALISIGISIGLLISLMVVSFLIAAVVGWDKGVHIQIGSHARAVYMLQYIGWFPLILNLLATFGFAYGFLRLSPWLVSIALWETSRPPLTRTRGLRRELLQIAAIYTAATLLWSLLSFSGLPGLVRGLLDVCLYWFAFMISIAILTEIYRSTDVSIPLNPQ